MSPRVTELVPSDPRCPYAALGALAVAASGSAPEVHSGDPATGI